MERDEPVNHRIELTISFNLVVKPSQVMDWGETIARLLDQGWMTSMAASLLKKVGDTEVTITKEAP